MAYNKGGARKGRKKVCVFCVEKVDEIDYKDVTRLKKFTSERAKILPCLLYTSPSPRDRG